MTEASLPSRPSTVEVVTVATLVVASLWFGTTLLRAELHAESASAARLAAATSGGGGALTSTESFAVRAQLVEAHLATVDGFEPSAVSPASAAALVTAVEGLASVPRTERITAALTRLCSRLELHELETGPLDPELDTARALAASVVPNDPNTGGVAPPTEEN